MIITYTYISYMQKSRKRRTIFKSTHLFGQETNIPLYGSLSFKNELQRHLFWRGLLKIPCRGGDGKRVTNSYIKIRFSILFFHLLPILKRQNLLCLTIYYIIYLNERLVLFWGKKSVQEFKFWLHFSKWKFTKTQESATSSLQHK